MYPFVKILVVSSALVLASAACSKSESTGYPEQDIRIVIPYAAGGGFDTYVRALVPYLEQHLPNKVNVLPINTPGAGGRRGASDVYRAQPDGYTIGVFNLPGVLIPQLQGMQLAYDLFEITWLATLSIDAYAYIVKADSPINSIEDIKKLGRPIVYGATGPSSTSYIATTIISQALQLPYEVVTGYAGSSDYIVGVMRGDVDAAFANLSTVSSYLQSGDVKMIAVFGIDSTDPGINDAADLGIPELGNIRVVRMMGAPPGMPDDIKITLENALLASLADPGFKEWLELTDNEAHAADAAETARSMEEMTEFYQKYEHALN